MRPRLAVIVGLVLALAVAAAGCGDDDDQVEGATSTAGVTTTAADATTTTAADTTTTAADTTTTAGPTGCDAGAVPAEALGATEATADVDGDGADDTVSVYGAGDPAPWHLHVDFGDDRAIDAEIPDATGPGAVVLGAAEISASAGLPPDGSGDEVFVAVGSGVSVALVGVFQYQDCELIRLTGPGNSEPSAFPVGGSVTHLDGLRCEGISGGQRLVRLSAESTDGTTYDTTDELLQVEALAFVSSNPAIEGTLDGDDPSLANYATIDCEGVEL